MQFQDAVTTIYNSLIERNFTPYEAHSICRLLKDDKCQSILKSMAAVSSKELKVKDAIEDVRRSKEKYLSDIETLVDILLASVKAKDLRFFLAPIMVELINQPTWTDVIQNIVNAECSPVDLNDVIALCDEMEKGAFKSEAKTLRHLFMETENEEV